MQENEAQSNEDILNEGGTWSVGKRQFHHTAKGGDAAVKSLYVTQRSLANSSQPTSQRAPEIAMYLPQKIPHQYQAQGVVIRSQEITKVRPHGRTSSAAEVPPVRIADSEEKTSPRDAFGISSTLRQQAADPGVDETTSSRHGSSILASILGRPSPVSTTCRVPLFCKHYRELGRGARALI